MAPSAFTGSLTAGSAAAAPSQGRPPVAQGAAAARAGNAGGGQGAPAAAAKPSANAQRPTSSGSSRTGNTGKFTKPVFADSNVREVLAALDDFRMEEGGYRFENRFWFLLAA